MPVASCAQIVSAIVNPNPGPANVNPLPGQPLRHRLGAAGGPAVAFELTVNNQCIDEGGGPRSSLAVTTRSLRHGDGRPAVHRRDHAARGHADGLALLVSASPPPTRRRPPRTIVVSLVKANGQVQDTLTYTAAEAYQAILTAVATQTPQPVGHH